MSLSPKLAKKGFEEGRRFNRIVQEVRKDLGPDAAGAVNFELRNSPSSPDIQATVERALKMYDAQQELARARSNPNSFANLSRQAIQAEQTKASADRIKSSPSMTPPRGRLPQDPFRVEEDPLLYALATGIKESLKDPTTYAGMGMGIIPGLMTAGLSYSPEAEGAPSSPLKMLQMLYRGHNGAPSPSNTRIFATPQKPIAQYYADKRSAQYGGTPTIDSLLVDPFAGRKYGHSIPLDSLNREIRTTQARELSPNDIVQKFAKGGLARIAARMASDSTPARKGVADVMKEKGGNWLAGSIDKSLSALRSPEYVVPDLEVGGNIIPGVNDAVAVRGSAINEWIDKKLGRYIQNEMATPEDPIRALAERGILHFDPQVTDYMRGNLGIDRAQMGYPEKGLATNPLAVAWEEASDLSIDPLAAQFYMGETVKKNPWLTKLDPDTPVYRTHLLNNNTGFPHLVDELKNSIDPESGLPPQLRWDPKDLSKVTVPQAVERVAKINEWRAQQKAIADASKANNAATRLHKEYAENNPLGLRWVELKAPEPPTEFDEALTAAKRKQMLQDALKYEGDTMGHCVGGYCDDVLEGRSRIYSLRDAKGEPHVTIETSSDMHGDIDNNPAAMRWINERARALEPKYGSGAWDAAFEEYVDEAPLGDDTVERIVQVKGKANRAPNPEYLPFVQDFVRSGKWSDVGDLENTGLIRRSALTPEEQTLPDLSDYLTLDEIKKLREGKEWTPIDDRPEFAAGGLVQEDSNSVNDDLMRDLLQIAAEKYHQVAPPRV